MHGEHNIIVLDFVLQGEDDHAIERTLEVAVMDPKAAKCQYKISVHTSDIRFSGTDANVYIQLFGQLWVYLSIGLLWHLCFW